MSSVVLYCITFIVVFLNVVCSMIIGSDYNFKKAVYFHIVGVFLLVYSIMYGITKKTYTVETEYKTEIYTLEGFDRVRQYIMLKDGELVQIEGNFKDSGAYDVIVRYTSENPVLGIYNGMSQKVREIDFVKK